jgi:16S rRNA (uracil1498-N3)-methyltransferase
MGSALWKQHPRTTGIVWWRGMPKYFVSPEDIDNEDSRISLNGENADHLVAVMRVRRGDAVIVCDGRCVDYHCEVADIVPGKEKRLSLKILSKSNVPEPRVKATLYQALPKADKMEFVIQKCVEMGITEIVPIYTDNSDIKTLSDAKLARYRKISEASAKQSMRGIIPSVGSPIALSQAIEDSASRGFVFAPYEYERQTSLRDILSAHNMVDVKEAAFFIGSEGGFSAEEANMFRKAGIPCVSLGTRILRTETAGFAVLTVLMYVCNELCFKAGDGNDG